MSRILRALALFAVAGITGCGGGGGSSASVVPPPPSPPPPSAATPIADVQGSGPQSPLAGQQLTVVGIVTADFQDGDADTANDLGGFYLQSETADGDPATSDGVFVFDDALGVDVDAGDQVEVDGTVEEFFGETQIDASAVRVIGAGAVAPLDLPLPTANSTRNSGGQAIADLEAYEGMLVRLPSTMTVIDAFGLERYGAITLSASGRITQFTNDNAPDIDGYAAHRDGVARSMIVLDDGRREQNDSPPRYLFPDAADPGYSMRLGDEVRSAVGALRYSRGSGSAGAETWRLMPVADPEFSAANPRPLPPAPGGNLRVMSFNALNFFTTIDAGQSICGPAGNANCRGANSSAEFDRQRDRLVTAIGAADAHVVGLMEIENNGSASLASIVAGLNAAAGSGDWAFVDTGPIGSDTIRVGLIYDTTLAAKVGNFAVLDATVDPRFDDDRNRPALAQTFEAANGARVTVVVNHLKSKGSSCDSIGDPDVGDGQANCNLTRTAAATALADWLATDPTSSGDADVLIIGDLNAYLREDPLQALINAGFENVLETSVGPDAYSYVFRGATGALDHALASPTLIPQVAGVAEWHINADEPPVLDYNLDFNRDPSYFDGTEPYRASDHDPVIVGLDLVP